jgi:hypothetical protein
MAVPPPMVYHQAAQSKHEFTRVGFSGTSFCTHSAMQTSPQFFRFLEDLLLCAQLNVTDHLPRKVFVSQRADGGARPAIEAGHCRIYSKTFQLLSKIEVYQGHFITSVGLLAFSF